MTRAQLAHVLRAAARIANDSDVLVVGSQAILASHGEDELPEVAWISTEADIAFLHDDADPTKADQLDGSGALSVPPEQPVLRSGGRSDDGEAP